MQRRFNGRQRAALYLASDGKCSACGVDLAPGWHADHVEPWSHGGETDVVNGQALCPTCNLRKGTKANSMATKQAARPWQVEAWRRYEALQKRDFLCCSCPGAGKTHWALTLARTLLDQHVIERVVIVAPFQNVRDQWVPKTEKGTIVHLTTVDNANGGVEDARDFEGCVVTYAQVAINPDLQRRGCARPTLVIFDEIHHAGDEQTWGAQVAYAFERAAYRVGLTGTPWRRPKSGRIPFVAYDDATGDIAPEYSYSYGQAVRDGVCRYIQFHVYDAQVQCVELETATAATSSLSDLSDPQDRSQAMNVILRSDGEWLRAILYEAHQRLLDVRRGNDDEPPVPDAQGLVIADDQQHARDIARLLERITGEAPELIISDEPDAKAALDRFRAGSRKWAVAVGMVSEGVDVTPLYVGVYANRRTSPLLFRQIVGRFVRRRENETRDAMLFMPAIPDLMKHASDIENELNQVAAELEAEESPRERKPQEAKPEPVLFAWRAGDSELHDIIRSGESYSAHEYEAVRVALEQANAYLDPVKFIATARILGMQLPQVGSPAPAPVKSEEPARVSKDVQKRLLKAKLDKMVKVSAARMGIEVKALNDLLFRRFGQRSQLSIQQLQEAYRYITTLEDGGAQ